MLGSKIEHHQRNIKILCSRDLKSVEVNSLYYSNCYHCVHKRCSKVNDPLMPDENFQCVRCQGLAPIIDKMLLLITILQNRIAHGFCYLGNLITFAGG